MLKLNMLWKQEKNGLIDLLPMHWEFNQFNSQKKPCFKKNKSDKTFPGKHSFEKQDFAHIEMSKSLVFCRILPYPTGSKQFFLEMKQEPFTQELPAPSGFAHRCICSQSKEQKSVSLWGIKVWLLAYWGWEKWQTSEQNRFPEFLVLIFFLTCGQLLSMRLTGRAEGQISDVFMKTTQTPSPCILRVHNSALNCISEVRNSKCCQALFKPWSATDLY